MGDLSRFLHFFGLLCSYIHFNIHTVDACLFDYFRTPLNERVILHRNNK